MVIEKNRINHEKESNNKKIYLDETQSQIEYRKVSKLLEKFNSKFSLMIIS